jgi:hypothetical protein
MFSSLSLTPFKDAISLREIIDVAGRVCQNLGPAMCWCTAGGTSAQVQPKYYYYYNPTIVILKNSLSLRLTTS